MLCFTNEMLAGVLWAEMYCLCSLAAFLCTCLCREKNTMKIDTSLPLDSRIKYHRQIVLLSQPTVNMWAINTCLLSHGTQIFVTMPRTWSRKSWLMAWAWKRIIACTVTWSVYYQPRDQCMIRLVISAWSVTWSVYDQQRDQCMIATSPVHD